MAVHASHAALPYAIKGARFSLAIPYLDADGDPTAPTTPDTEISKDNAAAADCAEEVSATSGMDGMGLLTLSGAETDCSILALNAKAASGPKATLATIMPRVLASIGTGTLSAGSAGGGTLGTLLAYDVTGCYIKTTGGTGGGGTGGANNQARKIITYNTSTGAFTVAPNWETTPDATTTYDVLLPEGVTLGMLRTLNPTTAGRTLDVSATGEAGLDFDNIKQASGSTTLTNITVPIVTTLTNLPSIPNNWLTAAGINDGAFTAAKFASGAFDAVWSVATRSLTTFGTLVSDTAAAVWAVATSGLTSAGTIGKLLVDNINATISSRSTYDGSDTSGTTTLLSRLTASRAGYFDNLNVGGAVASQADINALNQSASRRVILATVGQYERPESGSTTYTVEARTYDGDGAATNADSTPTLTATGSVSGSLAANLSAASNPATGIYRWTYTVASNATQEQIRFDVSATMSTAFTLSCYTQVVDLVSATWTTADRTKLTAVYDDLADGGRLDLIFDATLADTNELQTDWANGGRLDNILDARASQTSVNTAQGDLDILTGVDGVILAANQPNYVPATSTQAVQIKAKTDNLPSDPADASDIAAAFGTVNSTLATISTNVNTLLTRIPAALFSGITSLAQWLGLIAGKQTGNSTARTELRATGAGSGTFDETTDSIEAIRDRGDAAWITATGFSTHTAADVVSALGTGSTLTALAQSSIWTSTVAGRIDAAISTRASSSALTTAQNDLDILTGVDGVILAANQPNYVPATSTQAVQIKAKTDQLTFTTPNKVDATISGGGDASAANQTTIINHLTAIKGTGFGIGDSLKEISDAIDGIGGGLAGAGSILYTATIDDGTNPIQGCEVWVSTDEAGSNVVAGTLLTDDFGQVDFMLDAGDYYIWKHKAGYNFTNPEAFTVS